MRIDVRWASVLALGWILAGTGGCRSSAPEGEKKGDAAGTEAKKTEKGSDTAADEAALAEATRWAEVNQSLEACPGAPSWNDGTFSGPLVPPEAPATLLLDPTLPGALRGLSSTLWSHGFGIHLAPASGVVVATETDAAFSVGGQRLALDRVLAGPLPWDAVPGGGWSYGFGPDSPLCGQSGVSCDSAGRIRLMAVGEAMLSFVWDAGRLVRLADTSGTSATLEYGADGRLSHVVLPGGSGRIDYAFDSKGMLESVTGPSGRQAYTYETNGRLTSVTRSTQVIKIAYDSEGRASAVEGPGESKSTVAYESGPLGIRTSVTDSLGETYRFLVADKGQKVEITDALGNVTVKLLNEKGLVTSLEGAGTGTTRVVWDTQGRPTSVILPGGTLRQFSYGATGLESVSDGKRTVKLSHDTKGRLTGMTDEFGRKWVWTRDACGKVLARVFPGGRLEELKYDTAGRLIEVSDPSGRVQKRTFDAAGRVVVFEDSVRGKWSYGFDANGNLASLTNPLGQQESALWDADGRVTEATDVIGRKTKVQYDVAGRPQTALRDGQTLFNARFDAAGNPVELFDGQVTTKLQWKPGRILASKRVEAGPVESYEYDRDGRRTKVLRDGNVVWQAKWDASGRMLTMTPEDGVARFFEYDDLGRLVKRTGGADPLSITWNPDGTGLMTEASGRTTKLELDPASAGGTRAVAVAEPNGTLKTLTYTTEGWLATEQTAGQELITWEYDALGRPVALHSSLRGKTEYSWDAVGHLTQMKDGSGRIRTLAYGPDGRLASMKVADLEYRYAWDRQGRLIELTDFGGNKATYTYDAQGNVTETNGFDAMRTTASWDPMGRLIGWTRGDGTKEEYLRDGSGRLTEVKVNGVAVRKISYTAEGLMAGDSGPTHDLQYTYDANKRLEAMVDGKTFARVAFMRDDKGRLTQLFGLGATLANYQYDDQGRVALVGGPDKLGVTYKYDEKGFLAQRQYEGGMKAVLQRDENGRLVRETWSGADSATLFEVSYQYDGGGRLTGQQVSGKSFTYGYDPAGRLSTAVMPDGSTKSYHYDGSGGLVRAGTEGVQRGQGQRPVSGPGGAREYDAIGRLVGRSDPTGTLQIGYDPLGHLVKLATPAGEIATFENDGEGNLVGWTVGSRKVRALGWMGRPLAELEKSELRRTYLTSPDAPQPLGFAEGHKPYYYVRDQQGSVLAVVDGAGKVVNRYLYAPFGQPFLREEQVTNPYGYLGRFTEQTSGLVHFPARWADPAVASWLAPDPHPGDLLRPEGWNRYAFLDNDPVNRVDPTGMAAFEWQAGASSLEKVCNLFQAGKIEATHAFGKALDGFQYVGAIDKGGWVHDVWVKKIPGSDRVLTIFRDLNEKAEGFYGKPNISGNIVISQTPATPSAPAAVQQQGSTLGQSFQNGYNAVKQGVQSYGKEISTTVAGLGGLSGTLGTSVGTLAALPGGAAIIAAGAAVAGVVGGLIGTAINQIPGVQEGAQTLIGKAMGYDKPQILVNMDKEGEMAGPKMVAGQNKKLADNLAKAAKSGLPEPMPTDNAGGTAQIAPPVDPKPHKPKEPKVPEVVQPPDPGSADPDVTSPKDTSDPDTEQPDAHQPDVKGDITGIEGVTPVRISIPFSHNIDASYGEFKNIVTCAGTLNFWNVGSLVPGMGGVAMKVTCTASLNGVSDTFTNTGTFSGGPNGTFVVQGEHEGGTFSMNGGASVTLPKVGTFPNPNPAAFDNWPK